MEIFSAKVQLNRISLLICVIGCFWGNGETGLAQNPSTEKLWTGDVPGSIGDEAKDIPKLIIYLPEKSKATGVGVVIYPGGGYGNLAMGHEGHEIAKWLNTEGIAAFICDYRHRGKGYGHPAPMQDAQRAVRVVRSRSLGFGIQPNKIGVIGFSAGGHLASTVSTHFDSGDQTSTDPVERMSCRPDFAILCYPVIAFGEPYTHRGSQRNLIGTDANSDLVEKFSNEKQVTNQTPPTFLWHTNEDRGVPSENSVQYYLALQRHKVSSELHVYAKGRHGVGLAAKIEGTRDWPAACFRWLKTSGIIDNE